jgi:hypothetical protein
MNQGRWPRDKAQNMSLMQQLAINESFQPTNPQPLFSVNGPPGTGKTTMLQDIIAENITRRARVLASFARAKDCFAQKKKRLTFGKNARDLYISTLDPRLTGFEMVVVSTNNAAVENISKDLPLLHKLAESYQADCRFLQPIAAKLTAAVKGNKVMELKSLDQPWGLISVALGNSRNRNQFVDRAFCAPEGNKEQTAARIKEGKYLTIWEWKKVYKGLTFTEAKKCFCEADAALTDYLGKIAHFANLHHQLSDNRIEQEIQAITSQLSLLRQRIAATELEQTRLEGAIAQITKRKLTLHADINQHARFKPGILRRIFPDRRTRDHFLQKNRLNDAWHKILNEEAALTHELFKLNNELAENNTIWQTTQQSLQDKQAAYAHAHQEYQTLATHFTQLTIPPVDNNLDADRIQKNALWQDATLNELRSRLFMAALKLHEAWLAEVLRANSFSANLSAIYNLLTNKRSVVKSDEKYIWQSLFMWCPVLSSTFASIGRQFKDVGAAELGWLLVDEAGQAVPQAVVGALWRSQKAVVVGDPRQIEPVFTIPAPLIEGLAKDRLPEDYEKWLPTQTSVQVLADEANLIGAYVDMSWQMQWIGCPLRVHRRCASPMFEVANRIAYQGKMLQARTNCVVDAYAYPLGDSAWYDVIAQSTDKQYVEAQGQILLRLCIRLYEHTGCLPAVYIVTPFKRVKYKLQDLLKTRLEVVLSPEMPLPKKEELWDWCRERIGTVHTFQGKEAATVIFVLGADRDSQGALNWACSKPNLLNVALTRARDRVYVIGDFELWSQKRYFCELAQMLPRVALDQRAGASTLTMPLE